VADLVLVQVSRILRSVILEALIITHIIIEGTNLIPIKYLSGPGEILDRRHDLIRIKYVIVIRIQN
jgi:hypothetical protein